VYLYVFGGVYLDTDYKVLRPFEVELDGNAAVLPMSRGVMGAADFRLGNAVMASVPGLPFWREFLDELFADPRLTGLAEGHVEAVTGPLGLTEFYLRRYGGNPQVHLPRREIFHPEILRHGFSYDRSSLPVGVHLCWGSWRSKSVVQSLKNMSVRIITSF
jgi:mannosyltransferase OCH1-like enzyme